MKTTMYSLMLSLLLVGGSGAVWSQDTAPQNLEKAEIESIVRDYIRENPGIVIEAIQTWQYEQQRAQMLPKVEQFRSFLENDPDHPVLGNPDGDITVVEFFDYRCGVCKRHFPIIQALLKEDGNIRYIPRQFPTQDAPGDIPVSFRAATAAMAAHRQGLYEELHTALLYEPAGLTEDRIYQVAASLGIDVDKLKEDMDDPLIAKNVRNTLSIGVEIGFSGTPSFIIGEELVLGIRGPETVKNAIAKARATAKAAQASGR